MTVVCCFLKVTKPRKPSGIESHEHFSFPLRSLVVSFTFPARFEWIWCNSVQNVGFCQFRRTKPPCDSIPPVSLTFTSVWELEKRDYDPNPALCIHTGVCRRVQSNTDAHTREVKSCDMNECPAISTPAVLDIARLEHSR